MNRVLIYSLVPFFFALNVFAKESQLDNLVEKFQRSQSFHGNILVKKNNQIIYEKSVGMAVVEYNVENTMSSKFMIASLSKSFTAAAILKLESEGLLKLSDKISVHIDLPKNSQIDLKKWNEVTIQQALNHTAGFKRDLSNTTSFSRSDYNHLQTVIFHTLNNRNIFISKPTGDYYYSNLGYVLLAGVVENVSGNFYENYLESHFNIPLALSNTGDFHRFKVIENMTQGYLFGENRKLRKRCCDDASVLKGAASLYSDVYDLDKWLDYLTNEVFDKSQSYLDKMTSNTVDAGDGMKYGLGFMLERKDGFTRIHHSGHEWGYVSSMAYYPDEDLKIIVLANRHGFLGFSGVNAADQLSNEIARVLLQQGQ